MLTEAKKKANRKYNDKAYDRISIVVKKGQRDEFKRYAESKGMSLNGLINYLLEKEMTENSK